MITLKDIEIAIDKYEGLTLFLAGVRSTMHTLASLGIKHYERAEAAEAKLPKWDERSDYLRRLIASVRETVETDPKTIEGKKLFGKDMTSGYWLDIVLLCNVVESILEDELQTELEEWDRQDEASRDKP